MYIIKLFVKLKIQGFLVKLKYSLYIVIKELGKYVLLLNFKLNVNCLIKS